MRQPKRFVIVGVILATALLSTGTASGLTAWQQFGNAAGTGRGAFFGYVDLDVASATRLNPEALRLVVTATNPVETSVGWEVDCWNKGDHQTTNLSSGFLATPPIEKVITEVAVASFNYCELRVTVSPMGAKGGLKVSLQAQYAPS
jgi:hypothetical protein